MNKKDKVSISVTTKRLILSNLLPIVALATLLLVTAAVFWMFGMANAQDLNPPTTGKTSPRTTLTFGPNTPGSANRSSMPDNGTRGTMINGGIDHANPPYNPRPFYIVIYYLR
jgi:hypothetical protein